MSEDRQAYIYLVNLHPPQLSSKIVGIYCLVQVCPNPCCGPDATPGSLNVTHGKTPSGPRARLAKLRICL